MPQLYGLKSPDNTYSRRQSPPVIDTDRYTPPYENSYERKPEVYHLDTKHVDKPIHNEPSYKPSLSPVDSFHATSNGGPELYHLKVVENDQDNTIHDRRSSPALFSNNRVSPSPYQNPDGHGVEMYYIKASDENDRQSPRINDDHREPLFDNNNITNHYDDHDPHKVTTYLLTTTNGENLPRTRTPSPRLPLTNRQPIAFDIVDDNRIFDVHTKQRPFPTALRDVPTTFRHTPLGHSKASESIRRSMNKYRFAGN